MSEPINSLIYSKYEYVMNTGQKRGGYEDDYIEHRLRLNVFWITSLYEDNEEYKRAGEYIMGNMR